MKRALFLAVIASALLVSCKHTKTLNIAHYNVGVFSKEIENSIPMISSMMKEISADVISLNELDSCNLRHTNYQLADFAEAMGGWNYRYAKAFQFKEGGYGVGIATKADIIDSFVIHLDKGSGSEYRACGVIETPDYILATTHLDFRSEEAQLNQAVTISSVLTEKYGQSKKPVFLCGDMNAKPESVTVQTLLKSFDLISVLDNTIPVRNPDHCIDYIMVLKNKAKVSVISSSVPMEFKTGDVTIASDHLPVIATVKF